MIIRNPQGRIVSVTPEWFEYYKNKKGWEVISKPKEKSVDFSVAQIKTKVKSMSIEEAFAFTRGDTRKTVISLRDDLVQSAK